MEPVAKLLSYRFQDFNAFGLPDEEYEPFRQVVVFGVKKANGSLNEGDVDRLRAMPEEPSVELSYLDTPMYPVPLSGQVKLFRSTLIDEAELEKEVQESAL